MNTTSPSQRSPTHNAVVLLGKGGPERLVVQALPTPAPGPGEVRVRITASGAGFTDVIMRRGYYPYAPKFPFPQGYEAVGVVEEVGAGVTGLRVGQRVAGLLVWGGWAEQIVRPAEDFVVVDHDAATVKDEDVVALILNYTTAFQMIRRTAQMKPGQSAFVTGASGGVGQALLELLREDGVTTIGAASPSNEGAVTALGARYVFGRGDRVVDDVGAGSVDASFDGIGGFAVADCVAVTKPGGIVVSYGFTSTVGRSFLAANAATLSGMGSLFVGARLRGRRSAFYGITMLWRKDKQPFRDDLTTLIGLLAQKKLRPRIGARLGLLDGQEASRRLEAGAGAQGKIVLLR